MFGMFATGQTLLRPRADVRMFTSSRRPNWVLRLWLADVWMFGRLRRSTPTVFVLACVASRPGLTSHQPGRLDACVHGVSLRGRALSRGWRWQSAITGRGEVGALTIFWRGDGRPCSPVGPVGDVSECFRSASPGIASVGCWNVHRSRLGCSGIFGCFDFALIGPP